LAIAAVCDVLERFGFVPIETPIVEFADTLLGKYGEDEKLIYRFTDRGGRKLALRYDLTVPLARFIANNIGLLKPSFSRYQIGECFRGENTQKGRYRQFTQFDFDIVGSTKPESDAKIIAVAITAAKEIGFKNAKMAVNDRANFKGMNIEIVRAIDKIYKIGKEAAKLEAISKGLSQNEADEIDRIQDIKPTTNLKDIFKILEENYNLKTGTDFYFDPALARGLDYYTGSIFELKPCGKKDDMSIGGGGRYDKLIGTFAGRDIPAVGFSFGVDRMLDLL
jgi:histidyl-tRNA synthetase